MRTVHTIPYSSWRPLLHAQHGVSAELDCPRCGESIRLYDAHMIRADGLVEPAVVCPKPCGFSGHLRLEGWQPGNGTAGPAWGT